MTLADLRTAWDGCTRCPDLARLRTGVVHGAGRIGGVMLVGEAPGTQEDREGIPFYPGAPAGRNLAHLCGEILGLKREEVYLTNAVKCRPADPVAPERIRAPRRAERERCRAYLLEEIRLVRPRVVVALGAAAAASLCALAGIPAGGLGDLRARTFGGACALPGGARLLATYHPSPLAFNRFRPELTADFAALRGMLA